MKTKVIILLLTISTIFFSYVQQANNNLPFEQSFVKISTENPFYFELTNGETYIPVGPNLCWARDMETMESYIQKLADNGGNFMRIWLNHSMFETETEFGKVNEAAFRNIDRVLQAAEKKQHQGKNVHREFPQD